LRIVTTPMCSEIMELAGVSDYIISEDPDSEEGDLVVVLSETKTQIPALRIKLNTFNQIEDSISMIAAELGTKATSLPGDWVRKENDSEQMRHERKKIKVKVYSNFLREIVEDMGYTVVETQAEFLVYPDYMKDKINHEIASMGDRTLGIPSHQNAPLKPLERAKMRYNILERKLCTKL
jgi:segregation and condensation protein B